MDLFLKQLRLLFVVLAFVFGLTGAWHIRGRWAIVQQSGRAKLFQARQITCGFQAEVVQKRKATLTNTTAQLMLLPLLTS